MIEPFPLPASATPIRADRNGSADNLQNVARGGQPEFVTADVLDGPQQRQVQHVALRMAAAEAVRQRRQAGEQRDRAPRRRRGRTRSARGTRSGRAGASSRRGASCDCAARSARSRRCARLQSRAPTKASIACRSLKLQKPSSMCGAQASASSRQRAAGVAARELDAPQQRRSVDQVGDAAEQPARTCAS